MGDPHEENEVVGRVLGFFGTVAIKPQAMGGPHQEQQVVGRLTQGWEFFCNCGHNANGHW